MSRRQGSRRSTLVWATSQRIASHAARGAIINISSVAVKTDYAGMAVYCASKFGLMGFAEALAAEMGEQGIKVCTILPGTTVTEFGSRPPGRRPAVKVLLPEDVAGAVLYYFAADR